MAIGHWFCCSGFNRFNLQITLLYTVRAANVADAAVVNMIHANAVAVAVLSAIVKINSAAELDNSVYMYDCLTADEAHLINLDPACREKYHRRLFKTKAAKIRVTVASHTWCTICIYIRRQ